ncbi:MAG: hypothetical protein ACUVV4_09055 [Candidatus Bathyarchaeia archaeon]
MDFTTVSSALNFYEKLEDSSAEFYREMARVEANPIYKEFFRDLAEDNIRQKEAIIRVYRETITDILEVSSSIVGLKEVDYQLDDEPNAGAGLKEALRYALKLEGCSMRFCQDFSEKVENLLTDIGRSFETAAKRKMNRRKKIEAILKSLG